MRVRLVFVWMMIVLISMVTAAQSQTPVTTTGGTTNVVPVFTGSASVANSVITQTGNQVGIGTINNTAYNPLIVQSNYQDGGGIGMIGVVVPSEGDYAWAESDYYLNNPAASTPLVFLWGAGAEGYYSNSGALTNQDYYIVDHNTGVYNFAVDGSDNVYIGGQGYGSGPSSIALYAGANGNVGLGTNSPGARLEVNGNVLLTKGSGASITFADGTTQSTAYTGVTCGGDYADSVDVAGERKHYQPGDVLVLTSDGNGDVAKSAEPYSALVAGIYSTRPGTVGRRQTTDPKTATNEIPMAMVGIVPTKVTTENGPIHRGDLLVTASLEGYAMKGTDRSRMLGAVVGKAMGELNSGTGVIEVLVTLQ